MPKGKGDDSYYVSRISSSQEVISGDLHGLTISRVILSWPSARGILGRLSKMRMWPERMRSEIIELGSAIEYITSERPRFLTKWLNPLQE